MGAIFLGLLVGLVAWFLLRYLAGGFYTVNQNERAVKTRFGRAERVGTATTVEDPIAQILSAE
jgi:regulator of protease activity HflC (stomatin/prohibitin superfamily)